MTVRLDESKAGLGLTRCIAALTRCGGDQFSAAEVARTAWRHSPSVAEAITKATVVAGTPGTAGWGAELIDEAVASDFIAAIRASAVLDRLPGTRRVPFTHPIPRETAATFTGAWVGAGAPRAVSRAIFDTITLPRTTAGGITVVTKELAKALRPAHEQMLRDLLVAATASYLNSQFLDPRITALAGVRPASITAGGTQITSTGATAAAILNDLKAMLAAVNTELTAPAWIMRRRDAIHLAGLLTAGNTLMFPAMPRELLGVPVLMTSAIPADGGSPAADRFVVLVDGGSVLIADEGRPERRAGRAQSRNVGRARSGDLGAG